MSDTIIWFDKKNANPNLAANGVPAAVIGRMTQEVGNQRTFLNQLRKKPDDVLNHIEFSPEYGLFIRGTTGDIEATLSADMRYGIKHVGVIKDESLQIRYFRHAPSRMKTVSYVGIAGGQYWGSVPVEDTVDDARRKKTWAHMAGGQVNDEYRSWKRARQPGAPAAQAPLLVTSISLRMLIAIIKEKKGLDDWI